MIGRSNMTPNDKTLMGIRGFYYDSKPLDRLPGCLEVITKGDL